MESRKEKENSLRLNIFLLVLLFHLGLLAFLVFPAAKELNIETSQAVVINLIDIDEEPPPVYLNTLPEIFTNTVEAIAENIIEVDEVPDLIITQGIIYTYETVEVAVIEYLPMSKISKEPIFPEDQIRRNLVYPRIALNSGIEGTVYLELFIDSQGNIRDIQILRENPENRGFGEAAKNAFSGIKVTPAEADGRNVAVRYRYPVRFALR
ncbi:MAG: energy transducer TonB [Treponema sp.]|jgi:protein TonB|nr:energy transducer TonB [Treponema sp.]